MSRNEDVILFLEKSQCCGCGACAQTCPVHAISMEEAELGCLYPVINRDACVKCHKCEQICSFKLNEKDKYFPSVTYVAMSKSKEILRKSASGGVFTTLAKKILQKGGNVFGCSMEWEDDRLSPKHIKIDDIKNLKKLQGSKYVQSDLGNTYEEIKRMLLSGEKVLFSGTPCQVAGLKKYLENIDLTNLYTIDIICHGVPSKKLFQDYIKVFSRQLHGKIEEFLFRDKTLGWGHNSKIRYISQKGHVSKVIPSEVSSYYSFF